MSLSLNGAFCPTILPLFHGSQTRLTLRNLEQAVKAAGASLRDVAQVLVYLADAADIPAMDSVYRQFFASPYPNRSALGKLRFAHPDMRTEVVAYVGLPHEVAPEALDPGRPAP